MLVMPLQLTNAPSPITVSDEGSVIDESELLAKQPTGRVLSLKVRALANRAFELE